MITFAELDTLFGFYIIADFLRLVWLVTFILALLSFIESSAATFEALMPPPPTPKLV